MNEVNRVMSVMKAIVPKALRPTLRNTYYIDTVELLFRRDRLPPRRLRELVGGGDKKNFKKVGEEFMQYFLRLGGLKRNEKVLDVGCGVGQKAIPLTRYLDREAVYEGFDIVGEFIEWCRKNISFKYPNFHFRFVDVFNKMYNPESRHNASNTKFPYKNESFDFVFVGSVFTHMLPQDMESYLAEISRVLKPTGRCLITFFLLNTESLKLIDAELSTLNFKYVGEGYRAVNENLPESAVAYDENFVRSCYNKYRLNIKLPIHYGSWCGRKIFLSYQDIIIAFKE